MNDKLHWYMIVYFDGNTYMNTHIGRTSKRISKRNIEDNRKFCNVGEDYMCFNICYMGYMTAEEFEG